MSAVSRPKSFDELYREIQSLPEGQRGEILVAGEVHVTFGRPEKKHRRAAQALYATLIGHDENVGGKGWWIEVEPEVRFGERLFDPDLGGWRVERVPDMPEKNPIAIVPDWVCGVLSPTTRRNDLRIKLPGYVAEGVPHVWIVDPEARILQVFAPSNGQATLIATASDEDTVRLPPFDLEFDPRRLWIATPDE